jgi:osmotically-inducible protein OsmY
MRKKSLGRSRQRIITQAITLVAIRILGRKNDEELRDDVIQRLKRHHGSDLLEVDVHVVDSSVTLIGRVKTYKLKEEIGKKAWETKGVIKVLNEVEVTDAPTAGL